MTTAVASSLDHPSSTSRDRSLGRDLLAGVLAGQIAGLVMAVVVMAVFTLFLGKGPLYPVQVIGSFVFGDAALHGIHPGALIAGLLLHQLGPSLVWGLVLGLVAHRLDTRGGWNLAALAILVGLVSQVIDVVVVMPAAMKALHGHDLWAEQVPAFWSWAAHLVFGIALVTFASISRQLDRRRSGTHVERLA